MSVYSSSVASLSLFHAISRMVEEEEEEVEDTVQWNMQKANKWCPRIDGVVTLVSSLCMIWMAWNRRGRLFHRLVLGMSFHLLVQGAFLIYGPAAIPMSEANNYPLDSSATITTCTTQGLFIYITGFTSLFYYGSFSAYSYVGVLNNFEMPKIIWVEKYIHILVHIYPICSAFYILSLKGFNNSGLGFCYISSSPLNCRLDPNIPCERGPESRLLFLFFIIPNILVLLLPSIAMSILFLRVRKRQEDILIDAISIAKQGTIYLVALYWTVLPFLIIGVLEMTLDSIDIFRAFPFFVFVNTNFGLFALWSIFSYLYFSIEKKAISTTVTENDNNNNNNKATEIQQENEMNTDTAELKTSHDFIFTSQEMIEIQDTQKVTLAKTTETLAQKPRYSFNIFDGTDASGAFANFIHDGDSDDEKVDNAATDYWVAVQDHI